MSAHRHVGHATALELAARRRDVAQELVHVSKGGDLRMNPGVGLKCRFEVSNQLLAKCQSAACQGMRGSTRL